MRTLSPLWTDTHIKNPWKLVVYNTVIRSRVFYTLETIELTPSQQRILDTLYYQGLRRILKKQSTFINRTWTKVRLLHLANSQQRRIAPDSPKHVDFSTYYRLKRRKLLAHLLRAPQNNLCRLSVLSPDNQDRTDSRRKKRVGRPRDTWLQESLREAWSKVSETQYVPETHFPILLDLAICRAPLYSVLHFTVFDIFTVIQFYTFAALHFYGFTLLQFYSFTALHFYSVLHFYSFTIFPCFTVLRFYHFTVLRFYNLQLYTFTFLHVFHVYGLYILQIYSFYICTVLFVLALQFYRF